MVIEFAMLSVRYDLSLKKQSIIKLLYTTCVAQEGGTRICEVYGWFGSVNKQNTSVRGRGVVRGCYDIHSYDVTWLRSI